MQDVKRRKPKKVKGNRRRVEKEPRDWRKLFTRLLRAGLVLGGIALLVTGALLGTELVRDSDYFTVHNVRVSGNSRVGTEEITGIADVRTGTGIFALDLPRIGRKIAENPWIDTVEVVRSLPDEVVISVTEHQPRAVVQLDYLYYANGAGKVFKLLDSTDSLDYPFITGVDRQYLLDRPDEVAAWVRQALALTEALQGRRLFTLDDVSEIRVDREDGLVVYTNDFGVPILFGRDDFSAKLDRLERLYGELKPRLTALHYIDLNVADRVVVKVDPKYAAGRSEKQGRKGVS